MLTYGGFEGQKFTHSEADRAIQAPEYLKGDCTIIYRKDVSVRHVADFGYVTRGNSPLVFFSSRIISPLVILSVVVYLLSEKNHDL